MVTERTVEIEALHRRVRGQAMAKRFLGQINYRWKPLDKLVDEYNVEVDRYNEGLPAAEADQLRHLSSRELRESGVSHSDGEIWDVERLLSNADWAFHKSVRLAIDAHFRQKRAVEEKKTLLLHVHRICRWLLQQADVLFRAFESDKGIGFKKLVGIQLLHRGKVAQSFLKVARKYGDVYVTAEQRLELEQLHVRIVAALGAPMVLHDLDELEPRDDGGADPAHDVDGESDYGDFDEEIAEQLMQEFERELERGREPEVPEEGEWQDE
jgi:hypothetical protein